MNENNIIPAEVEVDVVEAPLVGRVEINAKTPHVLICVYGTLRRGEENYKRHLEHTKSKYLGTFKTDPNYTMYGRRAGFPILVEGGNTPIVMEVFKVTEQKVLEGIHSLEGCSGTPGHPDNWYDIASIKVPTGTDGDWEDAWIYVHRNYKPAMANSVIETGDWKHKSI